MNDDMKLTDAIDHARQVARSCMWWNPECARDHKQLADWLEELHLRRAAEDAVKRREEAMRKFDRPLPSPWGRL